ncbi:MAG: alpha-ketoglutarate-dependent dioxygenase AlkB [Gammaproteobacteria bacterium]|nr:alpha-ketoglutarate-dependent dioxygenase AlkB [Gammaproteobacteria bacterium]
MDLFAAIDGELGNILHRDGVVNYHGTIMSCEMANEFYQYLLNNISWQPDKSLINGQLIETRRHVAWYGEQAYKYRYSNTTKVALPWTEELLAIKKRVEQASQQTFNSCLLNLYHDGSEGMAWHSDGEQDLMPNGAIGSFSVGAERKFSFKHKQTQEAVSLFLQHGSLLVMKGATQQHWLHRLAPTKSVTTPRINLTFRTIVQ